MDTDRKTTNKRLAQIIADDLFTSWTDEQAQRLVAELPGGKPGGGWCKQAVIDRVEKILNSGSPIRG